MNRRVTTTTAVAIVTAIALMVVDKHDFDQDPPTDAADVLATSAGFAGAIVWLTVRKIGSDKPAVQLLGAVAAGVAIGAIVIGLGSVIYDPWAP